MFSRRTFLALLGSIPFLKSKPASAARESSMTQSFEILYGAPDPNKSLTKFLLERERDFGYRDVAAWPGWTKEERKQHLDASKPGSDERASWALWNMWYEKGHTEPLNKIIYVGRTYDQMQPLLNLVRMYEENFGPGYYSGLWTGWTLEERLSQIMIIERQKGDFDPKTTKARLNSWLEPYRWHGVFHTGHLRPELMELPRGRTEYVAYYDDALPEPKIDLHKEYPIEALKLK